MVATVRTFHGGADLHGEVRAAALGAIAMGDIGMLRHYVDILRFTVRETWKVVPQILNVPLHGSLDIGEPLEECRLRNRLVPVIAMGVARQFEFVLRFRQFRLRR